MTVSESWPFLFGERKVKPSGFTWGQEGFGSVRTGVAARDRVLLRVPNIGAPNNDGQLELAVNVSDLVPS